MSMRREMTFADAAQEYKSPSKLHPDLQAVVDRLEKRVTAPTMAEARFVKDGKAAVMLTLSVATPETLARLRTELGFELITKSGSGQFVIGRVPIEKLAALAKLDFVRYAAPAQL
jgi:hypothetical protein